MNRKKSKLLILTLALTSVLMTAVIVSAKPLCGTAALDFTGPANPVWSGTISGDFNGKMYFYATGGRDVGMVHFFEEIWLITDDSDTMILKGTDRGVFSKEELSGTMNGVVTEANDDYAYLIGHNVHMDGIVIPGEPLTCILKFRVN